MFPAAQSNVGFFTSSNGFGSLTLIFFFFFSFTVREPFRRRVDRTWLLFGHSWTVRLARKQLTFGDLLPIGDSSLLYALLPWFFIIILSSYVDFLFPGSNYRIWRISETYALRIWHGLADMKKPPEMISGNMTAGWTCLVWNYF